VRRARKIAQLRQHARQFFLKPLILRVLSARKIKGFRKIGKGIAA